MADYPFRSISWDPQVVTPEQLVELSGMLPEDWPVQTELAFLQGVIRAMVVSRYDPEGVDLPPEKVKRHYETIVKAIGTLLQAMEDAPLTLFRRSDFQDTRAGRTWPRTSAHVSSARGELEILRVRFSEDADNLSVGAQVRPKLEAARDLCEMCVHVHFAVTHELPPRDHHEGWFVRFMRRVGRLAGVTIGRDMVVEAIKRFK